MITLSIHPNEKPEKRIQFFCAGSSKSESEAEQLGFSVLPDDAPYILRLIQEDQRNETGK